MNPDGRASASCKVHTIRSRQPKTKVFKEYNNIVLYYVLAIQDE